MPITVTDVKFQIVENPQSNLLLVADFFFAPNEGGRLKVSLTSRPVGNSTRRKNKRLRLMSVNIQ